MTKEQTWAQYVKKNPKFETDGASFTAAGLRKFFDVTWEVAHSHGVDNGKALAKDSSKRAESKAPEFIDQMLGRFWRG